MRWWEYQLLNKPVMISSPEMLHSRHGLLKLALKQAHRWASQCGSWWGASCSGGPVQALRWESSAVNGPLCPAGFSFSPGAKVALCVRSARCAVWHICPLGFTVPLVTQPHTYTHKKNPQPLWATGQTQRYAIPAGNSLFLWALRPARLKQLSLSLSFFISPFWPKPHNKPIWEFNKYVMVPCIPLLPLLCVLNSHCETNIICRFKHTILKNTDERKCKQLMTTMLL